MNLTTEIAEHAEAKKGIMESEKHWNIGMME